MSFVICYKLITLLTEKYCFLGLKCLPHVLYITFYGSMRKYALVSAVEQECQQATVLLLVALPDLLFNTTAQLC